MNTRRSTDLDSQDVDALIKLVETRMATVRLHLSNHTIGVPVTLAEHNIQLAATLEKLKLLRTKRI